MVRTEVLYLMFAWQKVFIVYRVCYVGKKLLRVTRLKGRRRLCVFSVYVVFVVEVVRCPVVRHG